MKRIFSCALALCLLLSMLSGMTVFAATSGQCGENVTWKYESASGKLTISGTGEMYLSAELWGWEEYAQNIQSVTVSSGVTSIGAYAFAYLPKLKSVSLPKTLDYIYEGAFEGCESLTSVSLPEGLLELYEYAFYGCTSLTSITLPKSLEYLGLMSFAGCSSMTKFKVASGSPLLTTDSSGVLLSKDKTMLLMAPGGLKGNYSIPNTVNKIYAYAFYDCNNLATVTIPSSVRTIGDYAFLECDALTAVNVNSYNYYFASDSNGLLYDKYMTKLILIPAAEIGNITVSNTVTTVLGYAAYGCTQLTGVTLPDSVTHIENYAFAYCYELKDFHMPANLYSIGAYAFMYCTALESVAFPASLSYVFQYAFSNCYSLEKVDYSNTYLSRLSPGVYMNCLSLKEFIKGKDDGPVTIESYAFANCMSLESFDLGSARIVEEYAFAGCLNLNNVYKNSTTPITLEAGAFALCQDLSLRFAGSYTHFSEDAFQDAVVTVEYPGNSNYGWDASGYGNFGGTVTWKPYYYDCDEHTWPGTWSSADNVIYRRYCVTCHAMQVWDRTEANEGVHEDFDYLGNFEHAKVVIYSYMGNRSLTRTLNTPVPVGNDPAAALVIDVEIQAENVELTLDIPTTPVSSRNYVYRVEADGTYTQLTDAIHTQTGVQVTVTENCQLVVAKEKLANPFTDVKADQFEDAILWAYYSGITKGTSATEFSPEKPCTRKQIVTFLWRAAGQPDPASTENPFTDVKDDQFKDAILWAYHAGITKGTSATEFSPENPCTRKQIVTFLWRAAGQPAPESAENPFTDVKDDQFKDAILWAYCSGITKGTSAIEFSPENPCTRKQIVTFLYRDLAE